VEKSETIRLNGGIFKRSNFLALFLWDRLLAGWSSWTGVDWDGAGWRLNTHVLYMSVIKVPDRNLDVATLTSDTALPIAWKIKKKQHKP